jgi:DNA-binding Lrp family transcriptional regulator
MLTTVSEWNFLTNYGHVVVYLSTNPDARIRDLADAIGITERAAQRIVSDLVDAGYLTRTKTGRRNSYEINPEAPLRHPLERDHEVGELVRALGGTGVSA